MLLKNCNLYCQNVFKLIFIGLSLILPVKADSQDIGLYKRNIIVPTDISKDDLNKIFATSLEKLLAVLTARKELFKNNTIKSHFAKYTDFVSSYQEISDPLLDKEKILNIKFNDEAIKKSLRKLQIKFVDSDISRITTVILFKLKQQDQQSYIHNKDKIAYKLKNIAHQNYVEIILPIKEDIETIDNYENFKLELGSNIITGVATKVVEIWKVNMQLSNSEIKISTHHQGKDLYLVLDKTFYDMSIELSKVDILTTKTNNNYHNIIVNNISNFKQFHKLIYILNKHLEANSYHIKNIYSNNRVDINIIKSNTNIESLLKQDKYLHKNNHTNNDFNLYYTWID